MKTIVSKQYSLKLRDYVKGALMAVLVPCLLIIQQSLDKGQWSFNWKQIGMTAVGSFLAYIIKNFLDKPKVIITSESNNHADAIKENLEN